MCVGGGWSVLSLSWTICLLPDGPTDLDSQHICLPAFVDHHRGGVLIPVPVYFSTLSQNKLHLSIKLWKTVKVSSHPVQLYVKYSFKSVRDSGRFSRVRPSSSCQEGKRLKWRRAGFSSHLLTQHGLCFSSASVASDGPFSAHFINLFVVRFISPNGRDYSNLAWKASTSHVVTPFCNVWPPKAAHICHQSGHLIVHLHELFISPNEGICLY